MPWWAIILLPAVVFTVVQFIVSHAITPIIAGKATNLGPVTMIFKLMQSASKRWRALNGSTLIQEVIAGVQFAEGIKQTKVVA